MRIINWNLIHLLLNIALIVVFTMGYISSTNFLLAMILFQLTLKDNN